MEKVTLFEVDINTSEVTKSLVATQKQIEELTKKQKENVKATDEERKAYIETEAELKNLQREYRVQSKLLQDLNAIQVDNIETVEDARRALSAVSTEWARVTKVEGENSVQSQKLGTQKLLLTERLKKLEGATGDSRRNVGNYTASIIEAAKATGGFQGIAGGAQQALGGISAGFTAGKGASTGFIGGLKGIGGAITATGIGLFVQIIALLVTAFSKLKSVTDPVEQAFSGLSFVISELVQRGEKLVGAFGFLLKGDFASAANEAAAATDNLSASLAGAAKNGAALKAEQQDLEDNQLRLNVINKETEAQIKQLIVQSKKKGLSDEERIKILERANALEVANFNLNKAQFDAELKNAEAVILSKAKISKADLDIFFSEKSTADQRAKIQSKVDDYEEDFKKYADLRIEKSEEQGASLVLQEKLQNRLAGVEIDREAREEKAAAAREKANEKAAAAQQKALEAEKKRKEQIIKDLQEEVTLFEAKNEAIIINDKNFTQELVAEEVKRLSELQALKVKVFEEQRKQGAITEGQFQQLLNGLDKEFNDFVNGVSNTGLNVALAEFTKAVKLAQLELSKTEPAGLLSAETVQQQKVLIEQLRLAKIEEAKASITNATDLEVALFEINKKAKEDNAALDAQFKTEGDAREAINTANRIEILKLNGESELQLKRDQLELQRLAEIEEAEKTGADVNLINQKYAALNAELDKQSTRAKLKLASDYLTQFSQLVGENTQFGKLAASAAAAVNTAEAITVAIKAPTLPQRIAEVAFAAATGLKSIIQINRTKVPTAPSSKSKFEKGGLAGGKRHAQGGTKYYGEDGKTVELERGEAWYVLNRNATAQLQNLEALNSMFPAGKKLGTFQSGGFAQAQVQSNASALIAGADIANTLTNVPIVVDVKDIITQVDRRVEVVDSATF